MRSNHPTFPTTSRIDQEVAIDIWKRVGTAEFSYRYVADIVPHGNYLSRLNGNDALYVSGYASITKRTNLWKFRARAIEFLRYKAGDVSPEIEDQCRAFTRSQFIDSVEIERDRRRERCIKKTAHRKVTDQERCIEISRQILDTWGYNRWVFDQLEKYGIHTTKKEHRDMHKYGFCVVDSTNGRWRQLTPKAIAAVSNRQIVLLQNGRIPTIPTPEPAGGRVSMFYFQGVTA